MARKVFFSFHYQPDNWRAAQVRNAGVVEGNRPCSDNDWETITKGGDAAIQRWVKDQLAGKSCAVILIGSATAGRKWINYETRKAWDEGKGVVGIHIHGLKDVLERQSEKGRNPFDDLMIEGRKLSSIVKAYDTPYTSSAFVYDYIKENVAAWIEEAVSIRNRY